MAQIIYQTVLDFLDDEVRKSKNPEMDLKFMDPKNIIKELNLTDEDYPVVMEMIRLTIDRVHRDHCHNHNHFTDIKHWDGNPMSGGIGKWKYLEHYKGATAKKEIMYYFNNYLPSNYWEFKIGERYIAGDGSFSLWLDAPTIEESKYFSSEDERDTEFIVVSKPYWCLRTEKYLVDPIYAINMVDVLSLKTGRTYRFLNAKYDWDRFASSYLDRKIENYDEDWLDYYEEPGDMVGYDEF